MTNNHTNNERKTVRNVTFKEQIPETCPPLLRELLQKLGSKNRVCKLVNTTNSTVNDVMSGKKEMPAAWIIGAKAELGQPVIGHREPEPAKPAKPAGPAIPDFVPWNGKVVSVTVKGMPGSKPKKIKAPEPIAKLIEKFGGSRGNAAFATGHTQGWLSPFLDDPKRFGENAQRQIHNALYDVAPEEKITQDYDKYSMNIAVVFFSTEKNFDRINDIAEILNARLAFKKALKGQWMAFYQMPKEDLPKFKKLVSRDANDVICP